MRGPGAGREGRGGQRGEVGAGEGEQRGEQQRGDEGDVRVENGVGREVAALLRGHGGEGKRHSSAELILPVDMTSKL